MANRGVESSCDVIMPLEIDSSFIANPNSDISEIIKQDQFIKESKDPVDKSKVSSNHQSDKIVIETKGRIPNFALPLGWVAVNHESGGIVYLHKESRVVTWSRPYCLGKGSLRKHSAPLIAIPCLHQLSSLSNEEKQRSFEEKKRKVKFWKENLLQPNKRVKYDLQMEKRSNGGHIRERDTCKATESIDMEFALQSCTQGPKSPDVVLDKSYCSTDYNDYSSSQETEDSKIRTEISLSNPLKSNFESYSNSEKQLNDAAITKENIDHDDDLEQINSKQLHDYLGKIFKFRSISKEVSDLPMFHDGTLEVTKKAQLPETLKSIPSLPKNTDTKQSTIFAAGKTPLAILNEYCQRILKKKLVFVEAPPVRDEFVTEVEIDGVKYGKGQGTSKKAAKHNAARKTLQIIVPDKFTQITDFNFSQEHLKIIDDLDIEDPSVAEYSKVLGLRLPSEILSDCLKRNHIDCPNINLKLTPGVKNDPHTYEIICGKYTAKGLCENRKAGKQLGSQAILKQIHPTLTKWGQIVKIYCDGPTSLIQETDKINEDKEISRMTSASNDVLERLKKEMRKLEAKKNLKSSSAEPKNEEISISRKNIVNSN